jgi:hypothetical protein
MIEAVTGADVFRDSRAVATLPSLAARLPRRNASVRRYSPRLIKVVGHGRPGAPIPR